METDVLFDQLDVWVQLHALPFKYVSEELGRAIGGRIGEPVMVDDRAKGGEQGRFCHVRVRLPIANPLKRGSNIVCGGGQIVWVDYKYERINNFCY